LRNQLEFSHERDLPLNELKQRIVAYYPDADLPLFEKAFNFAKDAHEGQKRSSGEKYIIHPLNVVATLIKLRMDMPTLIAGLLHDVIEDCGVTPEQIGKEFSPEIAQIVVGLTKISKIKFKSKEESQAENFRKMVVAMAKDMRVIIVKFADRMHNMRTLQYMSEESQKQKAQETLDIYVPLASRLGINSVKADLEDLCLRFLKPDIYYRLAEKVAMKKSERKKYIKEVIDEIKEKLLQYSIDAEVTGRPKHFFSIYKKMIARGVDFDQIQDILAFRIIVGNITECYKTLGVIHSSYIPIPGRFKDYIAIPKVNNYQSLHTSVIGPRSERIEIQIRTFEMDEIAETGIAAHWKYKEGGPLPKKNLDWVQELLEYNENLDSNTEFLKFVKTDLDVGGVFIFTPGGDVKELSEGSTPLDFAYAVHTEIGNHCIGAKINGKIVPLRQVLKSGDTVEILTSKTQMPSKDWLNIAKTGRARSKIKQYLIKVEHDKNIELGSEIFEKAIKTFGSSLKALQKNGDMKVIQEHFGIKSDEELFVKIAVGKLTPRDVISTAPSLKKIVEEQMTEDNIRELESYSKKISRSVTRRVRKDNAILVEGMDDVLVRLALCCNPIPGDPIIGFITSTRGITVHTSTCARVDAGDVDRIVKVEWNPEFSFKHPVKIKVITNDKPGILSTISKSINSVGVNIRSAIAKSLPDRKGSFIFEVEVKDYSELIRLIGTIEVIEEVISVSRI
jgi:GTP diphosphokinase / guanosine-3',5'-bis(diphosphate) 3'-diphosphatase